MFSNDINKTELKIACTQYEDMDVHKDFLLPNIEFQRLEEILSDIEKQKSFRILGYILIPIIIGFFILKMANDKILILTKNKDELTNRVIKELETSNNQIKNTLKYIIYADAYLVYSDRTGILSKLEEYKILLLDLKQKKKFLKNISTI